MARALAATASRAGRKVSFFMRKGADVLAQRQQPAIIFFDEIDGLAPVRLSCALEPTPCLVLRIHGLLW